MSDDGRRAEDLRVQYSAPGHVRDVIASLGRTEDVRFAPGSRRLAIASAVRNTIAVVDLDISRSGSAISIALTRAIEIAAPCLDYPHGLDFLDDETLLVGSRKGDLAVFSLRQGAAVQEAVLRAGAHPLLEAPGSIAILASDRGSCELLVCNNFRHAVSRHRLDRAAGYAHAGGEILLEKWLDVPDGICISPDRRWIAVSNHNGHGVMVYEHVPALGRESDPDGILRGTRYPHGLCFAPDGEHLFVADAGGPYVHLYAKDAREWRGVRNPIASIRVMDEETFRRGRYNAREGGPKGIDIDDGMGVMVITSEWQPMAFFDLRALLARAAATAHLPEFDTALVSMGHAGADRQQGGAPSLGAGAGACSADVHYELDTLMQIREVRQRLRLAERRAKDAEAQARRAARAEHKATRRLLALQRSLSWRATAPLRWLRAAWRRTR